MDNKFKEEVKKLFPSLDLTYLGSIVSKIGVVPQVRLGNSLNFTDYEEVSLQKSKSEGGVLIPNTSQKPSSPADPTLVHKHSLKKGDLLLSYRAKNRIRVLRVKETPKRSIIGNTATVRIEFKHQDLDTLPLLIQSYIQLDIVQDYLIYQAVKNKKNNNTSRVLMSPNILKNLPVPKFVLDCSIDFERIIMQRTHLITMDENILSKMKKLYIRSNILLQNSLPSYINNPGYLKQTSFRDQDVVTKLLKLQECLEDVSLELDEYSIDEVF